MTGIFGIMLESITLTVVPLFQRPEYSLPKAGEVKPALLELLTISPWPHPEVPAVWA
jgi:hypothetical protein